MDEDFYSADIARGNGYSESKWVAEHMLKEAAAQTALRPTVVRIGQISGGENGCWNPNEWLPTMILSVKSVGCLPDAIQVRDFSSELEK